LIYRFHDIFIKEKMIKGELELENHLLTLICGDNGIGKSSFYEFLKLSQSHLFTEKKCVFIDQFRLEPLNDISFDELLRQLKSFRVEDNGLFAKYFYLVSDYINRPIKTLSGGQNQMIKILLGLYLSGDYFFFDEPLQSLDSKNKEIFLKLLNDLKYLGKSICLVEHNFSSHSSLVDIKYEMSERESFLLERIS